LITKPSVVSSAGDVNGDGLDDLIVSADQADPSGKPNISVGFAEDDIGFACVWLAAWIGLISTYN
jgi:hypothetical protein